MFDWFLRKKRATGVFVSENDKMVTGLKLQLLKAENERDTALLRKETDAEELADLRREVRELSCELQDAKELLFSERSLRESTLSPEALAVIELSDQITMYCAEISQIRALLKDCESKRRALSIQLSVLSNKLHRSEQLRRKANTRWRFAEASAIEWRKRALVSENKEVLVKQQLNMSPVEEMQSSELSDPTASEIAVNTQSTTHLNCMTTPRFARTIDDPPQLVRMFSLPMRLRACNQQF